MSHSHGNFVGRGIPADRASVKLVDSFFVGSVLVHRQLCSPTFRTGQFGLHRPRIDQVQTLRESRLVRAFAFTRGVVLRTTEDGEENRFLVRLIIRQRNGAHADRQPVERIL